MNPPDSQLPSGEKGPVPSFRRWSFAASAIGAIWLAVQASRGYFFSDDYLNLRQAKVGGFSWGYLTTSLFGHLAVGFRAVNWLLIAQAPYDYRWAIAFIGLCSLGMLWMFSRVLTLLLGPRPAVPILTAGLAGSMILTPALVWWSAILVYLPALLGTMCAFYGFLRFERDRSTVWLLVMAGSVLFGIEFNEMLLVLGPFLLALGWIHLDQGQRLDERWRRLLGRWPAWLALALPCLGHLLYWKLGGYQTGSPGTDLLTILGAYLYSWFGAIGPTFVGIDTFQHLRSISAPAPPLALGAAALGQAVFLVGFLASFARSHARALRGLLLLLLGWVFFFAPYVLGRSGTYGVSVGLDYLYLTPISWILPLCVGLAWVDPSQSFVKTPLRSSRLLAAGLVMLAWFGLTLHGQWVSTRTHGLGPRYMHASVERLAASARSTSSESPGFFVFDTLLPSALMPSDFYPFNRLSETVGAQLPSVKWTSPVPLGAQGYVVVHWKLLPATFEVPEQLTSTQVNINNGAFCLPDRSVSQAVAFDLPQPLPHASWSVEISADAASSVTSAIQLNLLDVAGALRGLVAVEVPAGRRVIEPAPALVVSGATIVFPPGPRWCGTVAIGKPVASGSSHPPAR